MEVQERILLKSHELFMRYGLRSISLDEIASQLGLVKKPFINAIQIKML
jgi:AcrR family transcriptional regulator